MNHNQKLGRQGEQLAEDELIKKGYLILEHHYLKRVGEIDLIAFDPKANEIVFVEVKARRTKTFGYPEEAVNEKKLKRIERAALTWLEENEKLDNPWRIDIMSISVAPGINILHFENVTL